MSKEKCDKCCEKLKKCKASRSTKKNDLPKAKDLGSPHIDYELYKWLNMSST